MAQFVFVEEFGISGVPIGNICFLVSSRLRCTLDLSRGPRLLEATQEVMQHPEADSGPTGSANLYPPLVIQEVL